MGGMAGCEVHLWRLSRGRLRAVIGSDDVPPPEVRTQPDGTVLLADDGRWISSVPNAEGYWFEIGGCVDEPEATAAMVGPLLSQILSSEGETLELAKQLAARCEEIDLLYTISHVLGQTVRLETAAEVIAREVASVVGAQRASIMVYDEERKALRPVVSVGRDVAKLSPVPIDHPTSIAAKAFREGKMMTFDPRLHDAGGSMSESGQHYLGAAYLSVPIVYPAPGGPPRPVGVINLTNRIGRDAFSDGEQQLVQAVASQIASAIENARLVELDLARQRISHEMEVAHDLQVRLLPSPAVLGEGVDVAARFHPAARVGGDFYHFFRLPGRRVGVLFGDVSSHGYAAAMIMVAVMSAASIHAAEADTPDEMIRRLVDSVATELGEAEMHVALFYAVISADDPRIRYTNAGHPHAFRVDADGHAERLAATSPPLGMADRETIVSKEVRWDPGADRLLLFSDGISDARDEGGTPFGEDRVVEIVRSLPKARSEVVVGELVAALERHAPTIQDDRTVLLLRL
jgi:sigma-B regulation protein RsbU (phosphoserine phosphatase)